FCLFFDKPSTGQEGKKDRFSKDAIQEKISGLPAEEYWRLKNSSDKEDQEKLTKIVEEHSRRMRLLREFHSTGKGLTPEEVEDLVDAYGISKDHPKFTTYPVCNPGNVSDECGFKERWQVLLRATVITDQVQPTIDDILARYPDAHIMDLCQSMKGERR